MAQIEINKNAESLIYLARKNGISEDDFRDAIKTLYYANALIELEDTKARQFTDYVHVGEGKGLNIEVSLEVVN